MTIIVPEEKEASLAPEMSIRGNFRHDDGTSHPRLRTASFYNIRRHGINITRSPVIIFMHGSEFAARCHLCSIGPIDLGGALMSSR